MPITYTTIRYNFRTISVKGKCKCSKCGRTITKSISAQVREDCTSDYMSQEYKRLEEKAKEYNARTDLTCSSCKKKAAESTDIYSIIDFSESLEATMESNKKLEEVRRADYRLTKSILEEYGDYVIQYKDKEYTLHYILHSSATASEYSTCLYLRQISKQKKWSLTDIYEYVYTSDVEKVIFTSEHFSDRRKRLMAVLNNL